nr:carboxypeptidase-like regulatory domain-containing protein [Bacteroidia bacterium]
MKTIFQSLAGIALFLLFHSTSLAQLTRISGKVTDALTGEPIPFASVVFKKSTIGVNTNIDGIYTLESDTPSDSISAQFLGYIAVSLPVKKGQTQTINFLLKASKVELKEAVIHAGENPANIIIKKVIANRDNNNFEKLNSYSFETYNKLEFDLTNITDKFKNRKIFKPFAFIFDN